MIARLPHWVLTDKHTAFYDSESKTCIEMVAKIYAKMQELVDDYNKYVDEVNKKIEDFDRGVIEDIERLKEEVIKITHNYLEMLDEKIKMQDLTIQKAVDYMVTNIKETTEDIANNLLLTGQISIDYTYFEGEEKLVLLMPTSTFIYNQENSQLNIITRLGA